MSSGEVVVVRRGRRSRVEVEALVAAYEGSGLTRKAFCAERGLSAATLDVYRKRSPQSVPSSRLLAVDVAPSPAGMLGSAQPPTHAWTFAVVLGNGRRIEVCGALDAPLLSELIGIVERA